MIEEDEPKYWKSLLTATVSGEINNFSVFGDEEYSVLNKLILYEYINLNETEERFCDSVLKYEFQRIKKTYTVSLKGYWALFMLNNEINPF